MITPNTPVTLRAIEPEDLDLLYRIENDIHLWNVGNTNVPYSRFVLHNYIANSQCDIYADKQVRLMIENESRKIVGIIDVMNFDPTHRRAEVGIVIEQEYRRNGFGKSALIKIAQYANQVIHLHQLYAIIDKENAAALKLFKEAGFKVAADLPHWLYDGKNYHDAQLLQLFL